MRRAIVSSQSQSERKLIAQKLAGFDYGVSRIRRVFQEYQWDELGMTELCGIALALSHFTGIKMDREDKRRKEVLLKWFEDNLDAIEPYFDQIQLIYD
jgi:hypothetical protein